MTFKPPRFHFFFIVWFFELKVYAMKKINLMLATLFILVRAYAQKSADKKVATKFIYLPPYDVSAADPATITADFAAGKVTIGTKKLSDMESTCSRKGAETLKESIVKVTTYYYTINMTTSESFMVARDAAGGVLYSEQLSKAEPSTFTFGKDKCEYWQAEKMKKDYAAKESSIMQSGERDFVNQQYNKARQVAKQNLTITSIPEELRVYYAKGKEFDYKDLESAMTTALDAYEEIGNKGPSDANFAKLKECIVIWEKELQETDAENKGARINKKIARSLHENCFNAYLYTYQIEEAKVHGRKALKLWGNFTNNQTIRLKTQIAAMDRRKAGVRANEGLVANLSDLNAKASAFKKVNIKVNKLTAADVPTLKAEYQQHGLASRIAENEEQNADEDALIESGELNPYQKYVTKSASQGDIIVMSTLTMQPELTELPKEMCELTSLEQISIWGNKISSVSPDIGKLENLTKLSLNNNQLTTLPPEIGQLTNLKTLSLNKNPISSLPEEIKGCTSLKTLNLKGSSISSGDQAKLAEWLPNCKIKY